MWRTKRDLTLKSLMSLRVKISLYAMGMVLSDIFESNLTELHGKQKTNVHITKFRLSSLPNLPLKKDAR